jgi:hypothetical protein
MNKDNDVTFSCICLRQYIHWCQISVIELHLSNGFPAFHLSAYSKLQLKKVETEHKSVAQVFSDKMKYTQKGAVLYWAIVLVRERFRRKCGLDFLVLRSYLFIPLRRLIMRNNHFTSANQFHFIVKF